MARWADTARLVLRLRRFTEQGLGEMLGKGGFACVLFADDEPCVGWGVPMGGDVLPRGCVPVVNHGFIGDYWVFRLPEKDLFMRRNKYWQ